MVYQRPSASSYARPKPISLGWAIAIVIAFCALGVRACEASGDTLSFARILVSAIVLGTFFLTRRFSIVKGIVLALTVEVACGSALFVMVDYPFVRAHAPELGLVTVRTLERFEQRSAPAHATLAQL